jgi:hypothetical protein
VPSLTLLILTKNSGAADPSTRAALQIGSLDDLIPDELDPSVMTCEAWTRQGGVLVRACESLQEELTELAKFGSQNAVSLPRIFLLCRRLRSENRPAFRGFSLRKFETRIVPAVHQLAGFISEVYDVDVKTFEEMLMDEGKYVLALAASAKTLKMGPTVIEEVRCSSIFCNCIFILHTLRSSMRIIRRYMYM